MTSEVSIIMAFLAGLLSFLSPCVLPLIPSYFSILAGVGIEKEHDKTILKITALCFILGFSVVFIILGVLVNTAFFLFSGASMYINVVAGLIVIILGFNIIFDFLPFLNYEKRPFMHNETLPSQVTVQAKPMGKMISAFLAGSAFGAGWTPCIGPILTTILIMAGQAGRMGAAIFYLGLYSLGLGIPFFLCAIFFNSLIKHGSHLRSYLPIIKRISGILLIVIGIMIMTGRYSALNWHIDMFVHRYIHWSEDKIFPFDMIGRFFAWLQNHQPHL